MKLIIIDRDRSKLEGAKRVFADDPNVEFMECDLIDADDFDCIIAPGNSFAIMDGGFDLALVERYGRTLEFLIQKQIGSEHYGELNVGAAVGVDVHAGGLRLVYAPTMRVPMQITRTDNVYRAMRAALIEIHQTNEYEADAIPAYPITKILCPIMGAGAGKLKPLTAATQMRLAWDSFKNGGPLVETLQQADAIQAKIGLGLGGDPEHW